MYSLGIYNQSHEGNESSYIDSICVQFGYHSWSSLASTTNFGRRLAYRFSFRSSGFQAKIVKEGGVEEGFG